MSRVSDKKLKDWADAENMGDFTGFTMEDAADMAQELQLQRKVMEEFRYRHTGSCGMNKWKSSGGGYRYDPNAECLCDNQTLSALDKMDEIVKSNQQS